LEEMMLILKRIFLVLSIAISLSFVGCTKKPAKITCKNNSDCLLTQNGKQTQGVCHMGVCEECMSDTDCKDLKKCVNNRCKSACKIDADCDENSYCDNKTCLSKCSDDDGSCPPGNSCSLGKCVADNKINSNSLSGEITDCNDLAKIYFEFDSSKINNNHEQDIAKLAKCLQDNPSKKLTILGHTDERGTKEYNLALGERRAQAVKSYLSSTHSIASKQIQIVSYGSEKPQVQGADESAYAKNRRAEFSLEK